MCSIVHGLHRCSHWLSARLLTPALGLTILPQPLAPQLHRVRQQGRRQATALHCSSVCELGRGFACLQRGHVDACAGCRGRKGRSSSPSHPCPCRDPTLPSGTASLQATHPHGTPSPTASAPPWTTEPLLSFGPAAPWERRCPGHAGGGTAAPAPVVTAGPCGWTGPGPSAHGSPTPAHACTCPRGCRSPGGTGSPGTLGTVSRPTCDRAESSGGSGLAAP